MSYKQSTCKGCGAAMIWCRTSRGKRMPLDYEPSRDGVFVIEGDEKDPLAVRLASYAAASYKGDKYVPHWKTCPKSESFRNKNEDRDS